MGFGGLESLRLRADKKQHLNTMEFHVLLPSSVNKTIILLLVKTEGGDEQTTIKLSESHFGFHSMDGKIVDKVRYR